MQRTTAETARFAGVAGVGWTVANLVGGFAAGEPPSLDADGSTIRSWLVDHRSALIAGAVVFAATIPLLITFFGAIIGRMRAGSDDRSATAAAGGAIGLAVGLAGLALAYVLMLPLVLDGSLAAAAGEDVVQLLFVSTFVFTMVGNIGCATTLLAIAASAHTGLGVLARRSAAAIGIVVLAASAAGLANTDIAAVAALAFVPVAIWVFAVGVSMVRARSTVGRPVATVTA